MSSSNELHARLLEDARRYDPAVHHRSLLGPYHDVVLLWRVKFMSYEQISATLARNGLKVSAAAVGVFCRNNFSKADIERARREQGQAPRSAPPAVPAPAARTASSQAGPRGPRIARDDY